MLSYSKNVWTKVRQLTGRDLTTTDESQSSAITISTDADFVVARCKRTANAQCASELITEWRLFKMLEAVRPIATGLHDLPAWFLKVGAPFFATIIADMFDLSLSTFAVPQPMESRLNLSCAKESHTTHPR
jgi:hypothetical protein